MTTQRMVIVDAILKFDFGDYRMDEFPKWVDESRENPSDLVLDLASKINNALADQPEGVDE